MLIWAQLAWPMITRQLTRVCGTTCCVFNWINCLIACPQLYHLNQQDKATQEITAQTVLSSTVSNWWQKLRTSDCWLSSRDFLSIFHLQYFPVDSLSRHLKKKNKKKPMQLNTWKSQFIQTPFCLLHFQKEKEYQIVELLTRAINDNVHWPRSLQIKVHNY